jgi:uncharacterized membrane protein
MANLAHVHVIAGAGEHPAHIVVRRIGLNDLRDAVMRGLEDFWAMPSQVAFIGLLYPIVGVVLVMATSDQNGLPLLYPLVSGFALIGPFAAIGLYEMSRRRELGLDTSWEHAFEVLRSPSIPAILALGVVLMVLFVLWLAAAQWLYQSLFGPWAPDSYLRFLREVFTTAPGLKLILFGNIIGFVFAAIVLSMSVVSFPLLLDRDVGAAVAIQTSIKAVIKNPVMIALWGLFVAASLIAGTLALFFGLAIVMPVLGHSTWHLYRRVVAPAAPEERFPTARIE